MRTRFLLGLAVVLLVGLVAAPAAQAGHSWTARPAQTAAAQLTTRHGWVTDKTELAREGVHDLTAAQLAAVTCASNSTWNGTRIIPASFLPSPPDLPWTLCDSGGGKLIMQDDRNLVLYNPIGQAVAASATNCGGCTYNRLHLQNDSNIVISDDSITPPIVHFSANTCCFTDSPGSNHHDIRARSDARGGGIYRHWVDSSVRLNGSNANIWDRGIPNWEYSWSGG